MAFSLSTIKKIKDESAMQGFLAGEEANKKGRRAEKIRRMENKTPDDAELELKLRKEAERARERQKAFEFLNRRSGLGEKILQGYFTYKMASLACRTLVALSGAEAGLYGMRGSRGGLGYDLYDAVSGKSEGEAMQQISSVQEAQAARARQIEDSIEAFQRISDDAERLGITEKGHPLLSADDKEKMHDLANLSYDKSCTPEEYATRCANLGLDYQGALEAAKSDRDLSPVDLDRDRNNGREMSDPGLEYC